MHSLSPLDSVRFIEISSQKWLRIKSAAADSSSKVFSNGGRTPIQNIERPYTFQMDPSIPLPVRKPNNGEDSGVESQKEGGAADITEEQILSGILTVLAYDKENKNAPYYRRFILDARPKIKAELNEAAMLKAKDGAWDESEEIWLALNGLDPDDKRIILNMAIFFDQRADSLRNNFLEGDADYYDDLALRYYKRLIDDETERGLETANAYFNFAFFCLKKQNFTEAGEYFKTYLSLISNLSDQELGEDGVYRRDRARELADSISKRDLGNEQFRKSYELINSGKEKEGIEEIKKFITAHPYVWNAWFLLGWGLRKLERFEDAKKAFLKAQECDGSEDSADLLNELAICQMETGEIDKAEESLIEALRLDGDNTKIISNLGLLSLKMGRPDYAKRYFQVVLEINPSDKIALSQMERLKAVDLHGN